MPKPIALELYSVRDLYREDFEACIQQTAALGYKGVECFGPPALSAERVTAALAANHLELVGWHLPIETLEGDKLPETIAYLKATNCTRAVVPWMPPETFASVDSVIAFANRMNAIASALTPHRITLGYHNHAAEFIPLPDGTLPWNLFMEHSNVFGQLDTGNALASKTPDIDLTQVVSLWPGRAETVHLKPYSYQNGLETMIGVDDVPWVSFIEAAETVGKAMWLIVEYEEEKLYEQFEGARRCIRALESIVA